MSDVIENRRIKLLKNDISVSVVNKISILLSLYRCLG